MTVTTLALIRDWRVKRGGWDSLDDNRNANRDPAKIACYTFASLQIALENEECDGAPEDNLETADDNVGFVAVPPLELLNMVGYEHVCE